MPSDRNRQPAILNADTHPPGEQLHVSAMGQSYRIHCQTSEAVCRAIDRAFAGMKINAPAGIQPSSTFRVTEGPNTFEVELGAETQVATDPGDLLYLLDKGITLSLQGERRDLYFIHGGAVTTPDGRVIVLTAASGSGKSTLTWALLHHGFGYLSDELAPVNPNTLGVQAYPHAVCLKRRPPDPYVLPPDTLVTSRSMHIPVRASSDSGQLAAIFFVDHRHPVDHPVLTRLGAARAALRLYPNALNPLAHANDGLDAVTEITRQVPCYELNTANLPAACKAVCALF